MPMAEHMGEGIDLDETVIASVPDELPGTDPYSQEVQTQWQLGLGLSEVPSLSPDR